jgi:hypothetical protein
MKNNRVSLGKGISKPRIWVLATNWLLLSKQLEGPTLSSPVSKILQSVLLGCLHPDRALGLNLHFENA